MMKIRMYVSPIRVDERNEENGMEEASIACDQKIRYKLPKV